MDLQGPSGDGEPSITFPRTIEDGVHTSITVDACVQAILRRPDPRQRLNLAMTIECAFRRPDRIAGHVPRYMQIPRDRLDHLTTGILARIRTIVAKINIPFSPPENPAD